MTAATAERQASIRDALDNPRRPRWTAAEKAKHRADLIAALTGQAWDQPIPNPLRRPTRKAGR